MNPLYINAIVCNLNVKNHCLVITNPRFNETLAKFKAMSMPYDSIILQRKTGSISFDAMNWLIEHNVSFTVLNWKGEILAQILPKEPISNELKLAQIATYQNQLRHTYIVKRIINSKIHCQKRLLEQLSQYFPIQVPKADSIKTNDLAYIKSLEALYAKDYFVQYGLICKELGYDFNGRFSIHARNMRSSDTINSLLNYSYACLQTYIRRSINSIGLQDDIPFLHDLRPQKTGLVYDLMDIGYRCACDYSVIQTLEQLNANKKMKASMVNSRYETVLTQDSISLLMSNLKLNLSLEEIIVNTRALARYIIGKSNSINFKVKPIDVRRNDDQETKELILSKYASELKVNKSTLWYQKKRLLERGSVRLYAKTANHLSQCHSA